MSKTLFTDKELRGLEYLMSSYPNNYERKKKKENTVKEKYSLFDVNSIPNPVIPQKYENLLKVCFAKFQNSNLQDRLLSLSIGVHRKWFLSALHKNLYLKTINEGGDTKSKEYKAAIFLLTSTKEIWNRAKEIIHTDRIDISHINLKGIAPMEYALYKCAKSIISGKINLTVDELADKGIIDQRTFKTIVHALLILNYGDEVLNVRI